MSNEAFQPDAFQEDAFQTGSRGTAVFVKASTAHRLSVATSPAGRVYLAMAISKSIKVVNYLSEKITVS